LYSLSSWEGRGLLALLQGDPEVMHREFETALKRNPQDRDVQSCPNELRRETTTLEKAVEQTPDQVSLRSATSWPGRIFLQKKYDLVLEILEKAIKFVSNDSEQRNYLENRRAFVKRAAKEALENESANR
jgi:hypothetical protein